MVSFSWNARQRWIINILGFCLSAYCSPVLYYQLVDGKEIQWYRKFQTEQVARLSLRLWKCESLAALLQGFLMAPWKLTILPCLHKSSCFFFPFPDHCISTLTNTSSVWINSLGPLSKSYFSLLIRLELEGLCSISQIIPFISQTDKNVDVPLWHFHLLR